MGGEQDIQGILHGNVAQEDRGGQVGWDLLVQDEVEPAVTGQDFDDLLEVRVAKFQSHGLPEGVTQGTRQGLVTPQLVVDLAAQRPRFRKLRILLEYPVETKFGGIDIAGVKLRGRLLEHYADAPELFQAGQAGYGGLVAWV